MVGMTIKPMVILRMLDDEDLAYMKQSDLYRLCIAITLDLQLDLEQPGNSKIFLA